MEKVNTILFDLDGTLLSIDMKDFQDHYFGSLMRAFKGFKDPEFVQTILTKPMKNVVLNDGLETNETVFLNTIKDGLSKSEINEVSNIFNQFYKNEYLTLRKHVNKEDIIPKSIEILKEKGYKLVIATNPLFPLEAIKTRIQWANIDINDFEFVTSLETSYFAKPNVNYYKEIIKKLDKKPEECFMVGNDVIEDLAIQSLGVKTFLITDHILNRGGIDYESDFEGDYNDYLDFVKSLPKVKK